MTCLGLSASGDYGMGIVADNCDDADTCVKGIINREIYMDPRPAPGYSGWYCDPQPGQPDCMDDGAITGLARMLLHEAGHLLYDLEDEYERNDDNISTGCCGHAVMSQSTRPMDFCTYGVHESEDQPPGCVAWPPWEPDNWTHHWDRRELGQARAETGVALDGAESGRVTSPGTAFQIDLTPSTSTWEPQL